MENVVAHSKTMRWLLEPESPGVRYLALRDLVGAQAEAAEMEEARLAAHSQGPIAAVLDAMAPQGYWVKPGPGYNPKYRARVWSLILLAQLGAHVQQDDRVELACRYVLDHALASAGRFSATGAPSGTADCLQGNLCWALLELGCEDERLELAFEWMARSVTGEGVAPAADRQAEVHYYVGKCGPTFACGSNNKLPCAWGAAKVMAALAKLPTARRSALIERAIAHGVKFLLSVDPASANYPSGYSLKPSGNWWKFGFPVFYITDLFQLAEALVDLGYGQDPRLEPASRLIATKRDEFGRWPLEYSYAGKTWHDFGPKRQPNKWVTLRALRVLKKANWAGF